MTASQVNILLGTYNGSRYLEQQLQSIESQTCKNWVIFASDDGSADNTVQLLKNFQNRLANHHKISIYAGPAKGFAANFLFLIRKVKLDGDFYAYADQDDIWQPHKLERALAWLQTIPHTKPALYCARTTLIDENINNIGLSPLFKKPASFLNALVQNIAGGNTMVFNQAALEILRATKENSTIVAHDWWSYLLISGAGGEVFYDACPSTLYRQHNNNVIGSNSNWCSRLHRSKMLFEGQLKRWIDLNVESLVAIQHVLSEENKSILEQFIKARDSSFILRFIKIKRLGIYRQTFLGNIGLNVATLVNKI